MTTEKPALILATQNQKKKKELVALIESTFNGAWRVVTLDDIGLADLEIIEDQETFEGNAQIKVDAIAGALEEREVSLRWDAILADDSGLCVDALDGRPGVRSARFASDNDAGQGDADNNTELLRQLEDVPDDKRGAHYRCVIAVRVPAGEVFFADGACSGTIARVARGEGGFGYDPYFVPHDGPNAAAAAKRHMAEYTAAEKHAISHRGIATRKALDRLSA